MKSARRHTKIVQTNGTHGRWRQSKGFTLIASLLMLLLLSGIAIGLLMMANTESKVGGTDLQNNIAYHAAEGGIEKMYSDLSAVFQNAQSPTTAQICAVGNTPPSMIGVTWNTYSVAPASGCGTSAPSTPTANWNTLSGGPDAGLYAQIIPVNMQATAYMAGGQEVNMTRTAQVALIPVFQFGVFSDSDLSFFSGPNFDLVGPVHTNGDLYPFVGPGSTLTFHSKVSAYGNVVRTQLANGWNAATNYNGTVYIPTANNGCSAPTPPATALVNCQTMDGPTASSYGDGSVTAAGSSTAQSGGTYIPDLTSNTWGTFSTSTNSYIINGNYWTQLATTPTGTGAKNLSMPFVNGTTLPYQLIRRPPAGADPTSALSQSQEYNLAQIHVLLSDDPNDLPGGAADTTNNIRLANIPANSSNTGYNLPYGIATSTPATGTAALPALSGGSTYNTYFAAASNAIPAGVCTMTYTPGTPGTISPVCPADWPYPPAPFAWTGTEPNTQGLYPAGAPYVNKSDGSIPSTAPSSPALSGGLPPTAVDPPAFTVCPTATMPYGNPVTSNPAPSAAAMALLSGICPGSPSYATPPYYSVTGYANGATSLTTAPATNDVAPSTPETYLSSTWNLIDGWLRVEYKNNSGTWVPVTQEWLGLGFARGLTAPTAPGTNPINPNAILLLQEPADRLTAAPATYPQICTGTAAACATMALTTPLLSTSATAPVCTTKSGSPASCTAWSSTPPQLLPDPANTAPNMNWVYGVTTTAENSASGSQASTLQSQSITRFNWYPINFYDAREGEVRDNAMTSPDNSCSTNGVMNAVEIDVGNLKKWLAGSIGASGSSVNSSAQNGYVLYFSDRRGMLLNPNAPLPNAANTKSGDSGLEDVINSSTAIGTPDGVLDPIPAGRTIHPEDVNGNGFLDNFGAANLGLGFYGTVATPAKNLNTQIKGGANPDPFGTGATTADNSNRIASCMNTGRKNWVSGARHVLRLVDGSLGNVPMSPGGTIADPGGFTVASENPVYIWGDYNSSSADTTWNSPAVDVLHSSAAVIADAVTFLSNNWIDQASFGLSGDGTVTNTNNRVAINAYYRVAIAGGKNINFPRPAWEPAYPNTTGDDFGTDGGVHNFLRYLENWNGTLNYKGSIVSLYYATYATGIYKCCNVVYQPPTRNYSFDLDFSTPQGLPPGTPMFKDVESLSYRQLFTARND